MRATTPAGSPDLVDPTMSMLPRFPSRWAAWWAGRRDGRRGIVPDPQSGLTTYLHLLGAVNATMVEWERLRTAASCAPIDRERAVWLERRERALEALAELDPEPGAGADMAAVRARRAAAAARAGHLSVIAEATERIAVLDERRAERVTVGELRIRRCTERTEQLVAVYWRSFQRKHPELEELRAGYGVPALIVPAHPLAG
ncbi:hypothetical protein [Nocardia thailandica]